MKDISWSILVVGSGLFFGLGCGDSSSSTTISVNHYDQSCSVDEDCVHIFVGDMCECVCHDGFINQQDLDQYNADRSAIECDGNVDCSPCPSRGVRCSAGKCMAS